MYHYVYRITNILLQKHYYGKRSSKRPPKQDLGVYYFSSSTDKQFRADQKINPNNYKYKVVKTFDTCLEATAYEIRLHERFNVGKNPSIYNKVKQVLTNYDYAIKISAQMRTGVPLSAQHRKNISIGLIGVDCSYRKKLVNIYEYKTHKLIAESVCLTDWCRLNNVSQGSLWQTIRSDRTKPSSASNRHHYKQLYAVQIKKE